MPLQQSHDLRLLRFGLGRAAAATAGVVGRELHRRRATLVLAPRVGATYNHTYRLTLARYSR